MKVLRPDRMALVAAALWLTACAPESPTETTPQSTDVSTSVVSPMALEPTLARYHWQLESAVDSGGAAIAALFPGPENRLGLEFADGRLGVSGGCNHMGAGYQLVGTSGLQIGQAQSTMMACPPPLGEADAAIGTLLSGTLQAELQGDPSAPRLRLKAADGSVLEFAGTPTSETRFGRPGSLAFLEVSTDPCEPPADTACLRVRDIHFDEQGLRVGNPGEWRALPAGIEGYKPTPGQRQVVRVKRFEVPGTAGSAPSEHFVLDLVVESHTVS